MYENQTSDLIFEKVLDSDRKITKDLVIAFLEQNGNFYYQPPLMSLSKRYHKTDEYGHKQLIKQFTDVLRNYSTDESDELLTVLNTQSSNPRLLVILKNKIDNFTDKSPATATGRLYTQMASNIVLADSFISRQEVVTKRQFTNSKIQDFRNALLPNLEKKESNSFYYAIRSRDGDYLPKPLISRNLIPVYKTDSDLNISLDPAPSDISNYFVIETSGYYFFDYEKALNYQSEISKFLNPYNIEQIFGKGSLANYYKFDTCRMTKKPLNYIGLPNINRQKTYLLEYFNNSIQQLDLDPEVNFHLLEGSEGKVRSLTTAGINIFRLEFSPDNSQKFYSTLMQRGFDSFAQLKGYRLSLFELKDYQRSSNNENSIIDGLESINLNFTVNIEDSTMKFYDTHIRQKIFSLLEGIERYYNFASDFCSFNNIDGNFNDFFVENVKNQFFQPFPWMEAPFYYYAFSQLIGASINRAGQRKRKGILLDLESIRQTAIDRRRSILPETGNLDSLQSFYRDLRNLVEQYFTKNHGLDKGSTIYKNTGERAEAYELIKPMIDLKFKRDDNFNKSLITSEFPIEEIEDNSLLNLSCEELRDVATEKFNEWYESGSSEAEEEFYKIANIIEEKGCP